MATINVIGSALGTPRPDLADGFYEYVLPSIKWGHTALGQVAVNTLTGEIETASRKSLVPVSVARASNVANFNRTAIDVGKVSYAVTEKALEVPVANGPDIVVQLDREKAAMSKIKTQIYIAYETEMATALQNTSTFAAGNGNYAAPADWADSTATIIADIRTAAAAVTQKTGVPANTLILNESQAGYLFTNTELRAALGTNVVTWDVFTNLMPTLFGLNRLIVTSAVKDTANISSAFSGAYVWDSDYVQVCVTDGSNDPTMPAIMKKVVYTEDAGDVAVVSYPEPQTNCNIVRGAQYGTMTLLDSLYGYLIKIA